MCVSLITPVSEAQQMFASVVREGNCLSKAIIIILGDGLNEEIYWLGWGKHIPFVLLISSLFLG